MSIEAMKQALEALEEATSYTSCETWSPSMTEECVAAAKALRQAIEQAEQTGHRDFRVPDGWKAERIDEYEIRVVSAEGEAWRLRSADKNDNGATMNQIETMRQARMALGDNLQLLGHGPIREATGLAIAKLDQAIEQAESQEPVAHTIIAGALFDFMGYLTSRTERIVLSASDNAAPAVDAIIDFAKKRGLSLDDALVREWIDALPTAPKCRIGRGADAPYPGMIEAFEAHYGQSFTDKDWRNETGIWAAAWGYAVRKCNPPTAPAQQVVPQAWMPSGGIPVALDNATPEQAKIYGWQPLYLDPPTAPAQPDMPQFKPSYEELERIADDLQQLCDMQAIRLGKLEASKPQGWKLVPDGKPTAEMMVSFAEVFDVGNQAASFLAAYKAMVSVAPTPQQRKPLTDEQAEKLCNVGPVYAPDGVVTRTPSAYRVELMKAALLGLRKGETAHGIKGASL